MEPHLRDMGKGWTGGKWREPPSVCSTALPGATRSPGQRGQDHFEPGVPDAIKGLGVEVDKLLGSSGVPSH